MSDKDFQKAMLYYPAVWAAELLPSGVPAGRLIMGGFTGSSSRVEVSWKVNQVMIKMVRWPMY